MKVFIVLSSLFALGLASGYGNYAQSYAPAYPAVAKAISYNTGTSTQSRKQDSWGNYAFAYNEQHSTGGSSRSEEGNPWGATGTYSLNVGDGRHRLVKYVADAGGFRAQIQTNEPGIVAKSPASVSISTPQGYAAAPVAAVYAAPTVYSAPQYVSAPVYSAPQQYAPAQPAYGNQPPSPAYGSPAPY